jgi:hypothetical protein
VGEVVVVTASHLRLVINQIEAVLRAANSSVSIRRPTAG